MAETVFNRLRYAWNAFLNRDPIESGNYTNLGAGYSMRPDRPRRSMGTERSMVSAIYARIGIDVASMTTMHARLDQNGRFLEELDTGLNRCLQLQANLDQTARAFKQDVVMSMFDEGAVAIVPVDTTINPSISGSYDVLTMRAGKILEWFPYHVRIDLYNERTGKHEQITRPKTTVAIVENPLYSIMNEPNSTLKRLVHKLNILDAIDEQSGSGKLDLIVQLPYIIKTDTRRTQAEQRRKDIESQLSGSQYGIAYVDGTEKVTQLNRPAENNLMAQIQYLTSMLYSQLGLTEAVFNGTADEKEMINYHTRTIEPVISAITDAMKSVFLTQTGRTQGQSVTFYRDPFRLVPVSQLADIADKFTRNEILSSNEVRAVIGYKPSDDPKADELRNKNLNEKAPDGSAPNQASNPINKGALNGTTK